MLHILSKIILKRKFCLLLFIFISQYADTYAQGELYNIDLKSSYPTYEGKGFLGAVADNKWNGISNTNATNLALINSKGTLSGVTFSANGFGGSWNNRPTFAWGDFADYWFLTRTSNAATIALKNLTIGEPYELLLYCTPGGNDRPMQASVNGGAVQTTSGLSTGVIQWSQTPNPKSNLIRFAGTVPGTGIITVNLFCSTDEADIEGLQLSIGNLTVPASGTRKYKMIPDLAAGYNLKVMSIGTSLTDLPFGMSWPSQLYNELFPKYQGHEILSNRAISGSNSRSGVANIESWVAQDNPDVVFIEYGINDAVASDNISITEVNSNLNFICSKILANNPNADIIFQTMNNPIGSTLTDRPNIELYYQAYRDFANLNGYMIVDNYPLWKNLYNTNPSLWSTYVSDNIHPDDAGRKAVMLNNLITTLESALTPSGTNFNVDPKIIIFSSATSLQNISITSTLNWSISGLSNWLILTTTNGFGNKTINLSATNNTNSGIRFATITITSGTVSRIANITQTGVAAVSLTINKSILNYSLAVASQTVSVTSTNTWTATSSQPWLTLSGNSGSGDGQFTVSSTVFSNTGTRTAVISVTGSSITRIINVTQTGILPLRIACLGNSITQGNVVSGAIKQWSYRYFLWEKLDSLNMNIDMVGYQNYWFNETSGNTVATPLSRYTNRTFDRDHDAYYGITSSGHLNGDASTGWTGSALPSLANRAYTPDMLLLHIGTNDDDGVVATTVSNINATIDEMRSRNPNVVILLAKLITSWKAINGQIDAIVLAKNTAQSPVIMIDMPPGFVNDPNVSGTMTFDYVHPNTVGSVFMAKRWFEPMLKNINDPIKPTAPSNVVSANLSTSSTRLSWNAATDNIGIRNYQIYMNGNLISTVSGLILNYTVTGLNAGINYPISVVAVDFGNNTSSPAVGNISIAGPNVLVANPTSLTFTNAASSQNMSITSNIAWSMAALPTWLNVNTTSGFGDNILVLSAQTNPTTNARMYNLSITGVSITKIVSINQNAGDIINTIQLEKDNFESNFSLNISPNPAENEAYSSILLNNAKLVAFDGRIVRIYTNTKLLDLHGLPAGLYVLVNEGKAIKLIVK